MNLRLMNEVWYPAQTGNESPCGIDKPSDCARIAHLTDLHLRSSRKCDRREVVRNWLKAFLAAGTDVIAVSGDVADKPTEAVYDEFTKELNRARLKWVCVPGNHDIEVPGKDGTFNGVFGYYPRVESHCGVQFILVDSTSGLLIEERSLLERLGQETFVGHFSQGAIGAPAIQAIDKLTGDSSAGPRVLVMHHHIEYRPDESPGAGIPMPDNIANTMTCLTDAIAARRAARRWGVGLVLHGHKHARQGAVMAEERFVILNGGSSTLVRPLRARIVDLDSVGNRRVLEVELLGH